MSKRAETGPMQFGDDWPGLFLRGDDAFSYGTMLSLILKAKEGEPLGGYTKKNLEEFSVQLLAVKVDDANEPTKLRSFEKCLDDGRIDFLSAPKAKWLSFCDYEVLDLWLDEGVPLNVLFPDGSVADGVAKSTVFSGAHIAIKAWGVVVDGSWFNLINLKVNRESMPVEMKR
jgi:hypothetical protein